MNENYYDDIDSMYPYGQFPINHTVAGQEKIKAELKKHHTYTEAYANVLGTQKKDEQTVSAQSNAQSSFDIQKLLPLFMKMQNGNMEQNDLLKMMTPMLSKNNNIPIKEMLEKMNQKPKQSKTITLKDEIDISSLARCDE